MGEIVTTDTGSEDGPTSAETTALAQSVGEHEARIEDVENRTEEAALSSEAALSIAGHSHEHSHSEYVGREELGSISDQLNEIRSALIPPPPPEPPAVETELVKEPDEPPKSREKRVKRRGLAALYYGK